MSFINKAARLKLLGTSAVTALVGTRIYLGTLPEKPTLPAITIQSITDKEDDDVPGWWPNNRLQVSSWSDPPTQNGVRSPEEVEAIAAAVHTALHHPRFSGSLYESWTVGSTTYKVTRRMGGTQRRNIESTTDYFEISEDFMLSFTG